MWETSVGLRGFVSCFNFFAPVVEFSWSNSLESEREREKLSQESNAEKMNDEN